MSFIEISMEINVNNIVFNAALAVLVVLIFYVDPVVVLGLVPARAHGLGLDLAPFLVLALVLALARVLARVLDLVLFLYLIYSLYSTKIL